MNKVFLIGLAVVLCAAGSSYAGSVISTVPGTTVDPSVVNVRLAQTVGDSVTFKVCVTVPTGVTDLDLVLMQDLSGSFIDDLRILQGTGGVAEQLTDDLPDEVSGTIRWGVTSFIDKPISPFGSSTYLGGDYVYNTDLALTSSASAFLAEMDSLSTKSGGDYEEAQIEALMQVGLRVTEVGWSAGAKKVVVLTTDADYHLAGDFASAGANDGDAVLDGTPAGTGEDYPDLDQVRDALVAANVAPIFAVTASLVSTYEALVASLGFGTVVQLDSDSANLVDAIVEGLGDLSTDVTLLQTGDDYSYVDTIDPTEYLSVTPGGTVCFDVTLSYKAGGLADSFYLNSPGFGKTLVNVTFVPLPAAAWMGLALLGAVGAIRRVRTRRKSS
jgi:hypothetical protein